MMPIDPKEMYRRYGDIYSYAQHILEKTCSAVVGHQEDEIAVYIVMYHYSRAIKLLASVRVLCLEGYATEASILLRSLFNLCINLKWLTLKDTKRRMERFADYEMVNLDKAMRKALKHANGLDKGKGIARQVRKHAEEVKGKYKSTGEWHPFLWSGKAIQEMADEVSMLQEYDLVYSRLSEREHTGPAATRDFLEVSSSGGPCLKVGQSYDDIPIVLLSALDYFLQTVGAGIEIVQLRGFHIVKECQRFQKLHAEYFKE
jgi:hypothetical protein